MEIFNHHIWCCYLPCIFVGKQSEKISQKVQLLLSFWGWFSRYFFSPWERFIEKDPDHKERNIIQSRTWTKDWWWMQEGTVWKVWLHPFSGCLVFTCWFSTNNPTSCRHAPLARSMDKAAWYAQSNWFYKQWGSNLLYLVTIPPRCLYRTFGWKWSIPDDLSFYCLCCLQKEQQKCHIQLSPWHQHMQHPPANQLVSPVLTPSWYFLNIEPSRPCFLNHEPS